MQDVPVKPFLVGFAFAAFLAALGVFAINFGSKLPNYENLDERYEIYEYSVTQTQGLYDSESRRTLVWIPGNPKVKVNKVQQLTDDTWEITVQALP